MFYVASRASTPERPAMLRQLRADGMPITSTWIDEAGEGETADMGELWSRIRNEIAQSEGLILYAKQEDFPLKGALVEAGIALGMNKPVAIVLDGVELEPRSLRPLGSWAKHPLCVFVPTMSEAVRFIRAYVVLSEDKAEEMRLMKRHAANALWLAAAKIANLQPLLSRELLIEAERLRNEAR